MNGCGQLPPNRQQENGVEVGHREPFPLPQAVDHSVRELITKLNNAASQSIYSDFNLVRTSQHGESWVGIMYKTLCFKTFFPERVIDFY